jgi:hypothetical protein
MVHNDSDENVVTHEKAVLMKHVMRLLYGAQRSTILYVMKTISS